MKIRCVAQGLAVVLMALGSVVITNQSSQAQRGQARFYCGTNAGEPATIAEHPTRGPITLIAWSSPYFMKSGWDTQRRCEQVSRKFQQNQASGDLIYIVSGRFNGYPVLCAARDVHREVINCSESAVLMTLRPGDNSQEVIYQIAQLSLARSSKPIQHSAEIFQKLGDSELKAIDVGVMLRYSAPTVSGGSYNNLRQSGDSGLPSCNDVVFGACQ